MSIEAVGPYSPDTVYGHLTMPFLNKPVHINAHTDLDAPLGDEVLTKSKFYNNQSQGQVSIEDIRDMKSLELDASLKVDIGIKQLQDFPPKANVQVFQASTYSNNSGVVFNALKNGYTGTEAINMGKAFNSYNNSIGLGITTAKGLINTNFAVS